MAVLLGIVSLNGVLEAVAAVILCTAVGKALQSMDRRRGANNQTKEGQR